MLEITSLVVRRNSFFISLTSEVIILYGQPAEWILLYHHCVKFPKIQFPVGVLILLFLSLPVKENERVLDPEEKPHQFTGRNSSKPLIFLRMKVGLMCIALAQLGLVF